MGLPRWRRAEDFDVMMKKAVGRHERALLPAGCHECWRGRILLATANNARAVRRSFAAEVAEQQ
jgi:hypothetical protein